MEGYKTTISTVSKELGAVERIKLKDTTDAVALDTATQTSGSVIIDLDYWAVLNIHNENANENKDYVKYVFVAKDGTKYTTGSEALWSAFNDIADEMADEGIYSFTIKCYRKDSKNRAGKQFLTCSLA